MTNLSNINAWEYNWWIFKTIIEDNDKTVLNILQSHARKCVFTQNGLIEHRFLKWYLVTNWIQINVSIFLHELNRVRWWIDVEPCIFTSNFTVNKEANFDVWEVKTFSEKRSNQYYMYCSKNYCLNTLKKGKNEFVVVWEQMQVIVLILLLGFYAEMLTGYLVFK